VTDNLDLWTSALLVKSTAGRGSNGRLEAFGIKKLRELILELAVRGKLLPQNPNDTPASVLLERIAREKAQMVKKGKIKKGNPLPEISEEEKHYELQPGWIFVRLGEVAYSQAGFAFKSRYFNESLEGLPLIRIRDVGQPFTGTYYSGEYRDEFIVEQGDYLISMDGEFRVAPWANGRALLNQRVSRLIFFAEDMGKRFIADSLQARLRELQGVKAYTTVDHLSGAQITESVIGLPPLAEQHRIVTKVDELMALCDQLELQQGRGIEAHQTLVETLLGTLTRVASAREFAVAWNRIAEHFDTLFTTEDSIDRLKQTILQLAVMGKLIPQDPDDASASVLLEDIAKTKRQKGREGRAKKDSPLPEVDDQDAPFSLPASWKWARFGWLVNFRSELVRPEDFPELDQVAPDSIEKGTGKLLFRRTVSRSGVRGPNNRFYVGQILYSKIRPSLSKAVIAEFEGLCSADMYPMDSMIDSRYLLKAILSEPFLEQVRVAENRIKMPKLNIESLSCMVVPVPPLNEQHRIVAKVDELMALCDALKARLAEAQTTQIHLADAIVERAVAAPELPAA